MKRIAYLLALPLLAQAVFGQPAESGKRTGAIRPVARAALVEAMAGVDGEYAGVAFYHTVLDRFGFAQPYGFVLNGKTRRVAELLPQFRRWEIALPENTYFKTVTSPQTLAETARRAIAAEERNVAMYDRLLPKVKRYPEIARVFGNAQSAARENLVLLRAAAANGGQLSPAQMEQLAKPNPQPRKN